MGLSTFELEKEADTMVRRKKQTLHFISIMGTKAYLCIQVLDESIH